MKTSDKKSFVLTIEAKENLNNLWKKTHLQQSSQDKIACICKAVGYPFTCVLEEDYVDKVYRDTYYSYFSSKYLGISRNCQRLSLFKGKISARRFNSFSQQNEKFLEQLFVGSIVLRPLKEREIGRTLLDPKKLSIAPCYVRTTPFNVIIMGHDLNVSAYPFSSQDAEMMSCAETTVWSILEYYGTRYPEYRTVLPSDIISELKKKSTERVLPSRGLNYFTVSELLKTFGFSPRIYALKAYDNDRDEYHRIFHYYIESGIPVAIGITGKDNGIDIGHSIVGIGHSRKRKSLSELKLNYVDKIPFVDSADFYDEYVVMDDNQIPYTVENYHNFTKYNDTYVDIFDVPLYKRIFLEATDAALNIKAILKAPNVLSAILDRNNASVSNDNPVVMRLYLTTSRKYKKMRTMKARYIKERELYANLLCPKFLWVAELATYEGFQKEEIFGEIVLDATASKFDKLDSIIMLRYFLHIGTRTPDGNIKQLLQEFTMERKNFSCPYTMYKNNLSIGGNTI